ncbi:hypothetical protein Tco_0389144 [Tanacetum coccineum]
MSFRTFIDFASCLYSDVGSPRISVKDEENKSELIRKAVGLLTGGLNSGELPSEASLLLSQRFAYQRVFELATAGKEIERILRNPLKKDQYRWNDSDVLLGEPRVQFNKVQYTKDIYSHHQSHTDSKRHLGKREDDLEVSGVNKDDRNPSYTMNLNTPSNQRKTILILSRTSQIKEKRNVIHTLKDLVASVNTKVVDPHNARRDVTALIDKMIAMESKQFPTEASGSKPRATQKKNGNPACKEGVEVLLRTNKSVHATPTVRIVLNKEKQIWKPKGKKFSLGEICQLTKLSVKCRTGPCFGIWTQAAQKHMTGIFKAHEIFVEKFITGPRIQEG